MAWAASHVFSYGEVPTAANLNIFGTNLNETMPAKVTTKGDLVSASGANAIARVAAPTPLYWSPIYDTAETAGLRYAPQPVILNHSYNTDTVTATVAETDTWTYTLAANALPTKGRLILDWKIVYFNNYGSITSTYKLHFGATSFSMVTPSVAANASNYLLFLFHVEILALNAADSQRVFCAPLFYGNVAAGASAALYTAMNTAAATEDTTSSKVLKCSVTHGNNSASISSQVFEPLITLIPAMT